MPAFDRAVARVVSCGSPTTTGHRDRCDGGVYWQTTARASRPEPRSGSSARVRRPRGHDRGVGGDRRAGARAGVRRRVRGRQPRQRDRGGAAVDRGVRSGQARDARGGARVPRRASCRCSRERRDPPTSRDVMRALTVTGAVTVDGADGERCARGRRRRSPRSAPHVAAQPGDEHLDAGGDVLLRGLVNGHTHAAMTLFRGYGGDRPLMEWLEDWIWPVEAKPDRRRRVLGHAPGLHRDDPVRHDALLGHVLAPRRRRACGARRRRPRHGRAAAHRRLRRRARSKRVCDEASAALDELAGLSPRVLPGLAPHGIYTASADHARVGGRRVGPTGRSGAAALPRDRRRGARLPRAHRATPGRVPRSRSGSCRNGSCSRTASGSTTTTPRGSPRTARPS